MFGKWNLTLFDIWNLTGMELLTDMSGFLLSRHLSSRVDGIENSARRLDPFFILKSESGPAEASGALASEGRIWTGAPLKALCLLVSACFSLTAHIGVFILRWENDISVCRHAC